MVVSSLPIRASCARARSPVARCGCPTFCGKGYCRLIGGTIGSKCRRSGTQLLGRGQLRSSLRLQPHRATGDRARAHDARIGSEDTTAAPFNGPDMAPAPTAQTAEGLSKAYSSDTDKYSGNFVENFEYNLKIFNHRCDMMGVKMEDKGNAISVILTKPALNFYFDFVLGKVSTYSGIFQKLRERYIA